MVRLFAMVHTHGWPCSKARCAGPMTWKMTDTQRKEASFPAYSAARHNPSLVDLSVGWHAQVAFSFGTGKLLRVQGGVFG